MKNSIPVFLAIIGLIHFSHVTLISGFAGNYGNLYEDRSNDTNATTVAPGNDTRTTAAASNATTVAPGNDTTSASPGNDTTSASPGNDTTSASPGNDTTSAGPGNDTTTASPGNDTTSSGPGEDTTSSGPGEDTTSSGPGSQTTTKTIPVSPATHSPQPRKKGSTGSSFDGPSFAGGIALGFGVLIIAGVAYTIYRRRATQQYNAM